MRKFIITSAALASVPVVAGLWVASFGITTVKPNTTTQAQVTTTQTVAPTDTTPVVEAPVQTTEPILTPTTPVVSEPIAKPLTPVETAEVLIPVANQRQCFGYIMSKFYGWNVTNEQVTNYYNILTAKYGNQLCVAWYWVVEGQATKVEEL